MPTAPGPRPDGVPTPTATPPCPGRPCLTLLAAGLLAGLTAFGAGEAGRAIVREDMARINALEGRGQAQRNEIARQSDRIQEARAALLYGVFGASLGLLLAMAGGRSRRPAGAPRKVLLLCPMAGGLLGAALGRTVVPWHRFALLAEPHATEDLRHALVGHGAIWLALGALGGLSYSLGLGGGRARVGRALEGGLLGALLATFLYELAGASLLTEAATDQPLPVGLSARLLAPLCVGLLSAGGIALASPHRWPSGRGMADG